MSEGLFREGVREILLKRCNVVVVTDSYDPESIKSVDCVVIDSATVNRSLSRHTFALPIRHVLIGDRGSIQIEGECVLVDQAGAASALLQEVVQYGLAHQQIPNFNPELSSRERQVLTRVAKGETDQAIAESLQLSRHGVKKHVKSILAKMGARNRTEAAVRGITNGWCSLQDD
jgi:DNA-binding NarL/FixJ family response regulator